MKARWQKPFQYAPLILFLLICALPFTYNRAKAIAQSSILLLQNPLSSAYRKTDRYNPITQAIEQYPQATLYFISDTDRSTETITSWQRIQTTYLAYPKEVYVLNHQDHAETITRLGRNEFQAIIVSPFEQPTLKAAGTEIHPHPEYYLYLINRK